MNTNATHSPLVWNNIASAQILKHNVVGTFNKKKIGICETYISRCENNLGLGDSTLTPTVASWERGLHADPACNVVAHLLPPS